LGAVNHTIDRYYGIPETAENRLLGSEHSVRANKTNGDNHGNTVKPPILGTLGDSQTVLPYLGLRFLQLAHNGNHASEVV
jgi:hypothetical protein